MMNRLIVLIVWLSLFTLITVADDKKCSVLPVKSAAIVHDKHVVTCFAQPGTMILSWKSGLVPTYDNYTNISTLGVLGTPESFAQRHMEGFVAEYYSLRKSTVKLTRVTVDLAGSIFCLVLNLLSREIHYCESKLNVFVTRPFFDSTGINLAKGIVTNVTCAVTLKGFGTLHMKIMDGYSVSPRINTTEVFTDFGLHTSQLTYRQQVKITADGNHSRVSPDLGVRSAFRCVTTLDGSDGYEFTVDCEVDAPVTRVFIVPNSARKCSERVCYMHERMLCTSDGKPKPDIFQWRLALGHANFEAMVEQTPYQYALISGRNTFECRVFNLVGNYSFTAAGRFTTHVEAYEWVIDDHATYESKGSRHMVWCPMTIVVAVVAISSVFMPCCRH